MREIKFRGFHKHKDGETVITINGEKKRGTWVYGVPIKTKIGIFIIDEENPHYCSQYFYMEIQVPKLVIPETVGQFTGLKDKYGKEIYEGDILTTENGTFSNTGQGYVRIYKGGFVSFYGQDTFNRDCFDELYNVCDEREIIGNIYENKELLQN